MIEDRELDSWREQWSGVAAEPSLELQRRIRRRAKEQDRRFVLGNLLTVILFAGILIFAAGLYERHRASVMTIPAGPVLDAKQAGIIGAVQGLCLPFRGLSRSGATISAGMFVGAERVLAEEFSFALAVILTPVADGRELLRLMKAFFL